MFFSGIPVTQAPFGAIYLIVLSNIYTSPNGDFYISGTGDFYGF